MSLDVIREVPLVGHFAGPVPDNEVVILDDVVVLLGSWLTISERDDEEIWLELFHGLAFHEN